MDEKVFNDILENFKNACFNDIKILSGLMASEDLNSFLDECFKKLYKSSN